MGKKIIMHIIPIYNPLNCTHPGSLINQQHQAIIDTAASGIWTKTTVAMPSRTRKPWWLSSSMKQFIVSLISPGSFQKQPRFRHLNPTSDNRLRDATKCQAVHCAVSVLVDIFNSTWPVGMSLINLLHLL